MVQEKGTLFLVAIIKLLRNKQLLELEQAIIVYIHLLF